MRRQLDPAVPGWIVFPELTGGKVTVALVVAADDVALSVERELLEFKVGVALRVTEASSRQWLGACRRAARRVARAPAAPLTAIAPLWLSCTFAGKILILEVLR